MRLVHVESSNIAAIGHRKAEQISLGRKGSDILRIQFTSGSYYDYIDVPEYVFKEFLKAESKGKFYHENIKDKYNFSKVE